MSDEVNTRKARRDKRKTECSINRRNGCGICGSLNIAIQGVLYCDICKQELEFLSEVRYIWEFRSYNREDECNCNSKYRSKYYYSVGKCLDCGAVRSSFCPNDKYHKCWKKFNNYYCTTCGYRK